MHTVVYLLISGPVVGPLWMRTTVPGMEASCFGRVAHVTVSRLGFARLEGLASSAAFGS